MKKLACLILSLLMLICTIGCNSKSIEMTLNDGILENDYFSIDVSGYEAIRYKRDELPNEQLIGRALAMTYTTEGGEPVRCSTFKYTATRAKKPYRTKRIMRCPSPLPEDNY